jgi:DNA repair protein RadD
MTRYHQAALEPIKPMRLYQQQAFEEGMERFAKGERRGCIVMPTGAGKSRLCREFAANSENPLVVVHTRGLLKQTLKTITRNVKTVQAISKQLVRSFEGHDLIILDECHHYASDEWEFVHTLAEQASIRLLGVTATPTRGDGRALKPYFDWLLSPTSYSELIDAGHLVPAIVRWPGQVQHRKERFDPVPLIMQHAKGRKTVSFLETRAEAFEDAERLRALGRKALAVDGTTDRVEDIYAAFERGEYDTLCNVDLLVEGIDVPSIACVALGRKFNTLTSYLQACGRGLRPSLGKKDLLVIDCVGCTDPQTGHGPPDQDRDYSLEGDPISGGGTARTAYCGKCWRRYLPKPGEAGKVVIEQRHVDQRLQWSAAKQEGLRYERLKAGERTQRIKALQRQDRELLDKLGTRCLVKEDGRGCPHCASDRPAGRARGTLVTLPSAKVISEAKAELRGVENPKAKDIVTELERLRKNGNRYNYKAGWALYRLAEKYNAEAPLFTYAKEDAPPCKRCRLMIVRGQPIHDTDHASCALVDIIVDTRDNVRATTIDPKQPSLFSRQGRESLPANLLRRAGY